jgi:pimeloyl-ACP methyl ester carboxylesterase
MLHHPQRQVQDAAAALLMLPGTLCDARLYGAVLANLRVPAKVATLRGACSTQQMAQLILASAPPRLSLCGFSLGAIVALEIIAQAPWRVDRLALIACNPGLLDETARRARAALQQSEFVQPDDAPLVHLMARETTAETYRQQTQMTLDRADSRPRLGRINVPTLVLCGAEDRICPPAMSRAIADAVAMSRLTIVPGAGHYLPIERPELVAEQLAGWLAMPAHTEKEPT